MKPVKHQSATSETSDATQWMALTLELWLVVALGIATGAAVVFGYTRMSSLEQRVEALEQGSAPMGQ